MTLRVLIDTSHGEEITSIPDNLLEDIDFLVSITGKNEVFENVQRLQNYDLLIMGNPKPLSRKEVLFKKNELVILKKYVYNGGKILFTSSAGGNFRFPKTAGSIDVLYKLTGVQRFPYSMLFHTKDYFFAGSKRNLVYHQGNLPNHPIFKEFREGDIFYTGLSGSTYLIPFDDEIIDIEDAHSEIILKSPPNTIVRDLSKKQNEKVNQVPLIIIRYFGKGIVVTTSFSEFLKSSEMGGYDTLSGSKLMRGIIEFLFA